MFPYHFSQDVIPIVMGARKEEYERVVPHHSIIHVDDFDTPRDLAEYLHMLDQNDTLYNEYFRCGHYRSSLYKSTLQYAKAKFSIPSKFLNSPLEAQVYYKY